MFCPDSCDTCLLNTLRSSITYMHLLSLAWINTDLSSITPSGTEIWTILRNFSIRVHMKMSFSNNTPFYSDSIVLRTLATWPHMSPVFPDPYSRWQRYSKIYGTCPCDLNNSGEETDMFVWQTSVGPKWTDILSIHLASPKAARVDSIVLTSSGHSVMKYMWVNQRDHLAKKCDTKCVKTRKILWRQQIQLYHQQCGCRFSSTIWCSVICRHSDDRVWVRICMGQSNTFYMTFSTL